MESQLLERALYSLGITKNGTRLYLQSYRHGRATVGQLAQGARMDRSSAYQAVDQLRQAGLLEETGTGRKAVWVKPPQAVLARLKIRIRGFRNQYEAIEVALPELTAAYAEQDHQPVLQAYAGQEGLLQVVAQILDQADGEILLLTNQAEERLAFTRRDHQHFIAERLKRGLRIRVLAVDTPEAHRLQAEDGQYLRQTRLISGQAKPPFLGETYLFSNSVATLSFRGEPIGFVVHSAEFSKSQRWAFEQLWQRYEVAA